MAKYEPVLIHTGKKDMRWGVRRYRNYDGTLTPAGKERYKYEVQKNRQKPSNKRAEEEDLADPIKWARQDYESINAAAQTSKQVVEILNNVAQKSGKKNRRLDLSDKSDKELRERINRELLERQYNDVFNAPKTSRGKEACKKILSGIGATIGLAAAATSLALNVHDLKYGKK